MNFTLVKQGKFMSAFFKEENFVYFKFHPELNIPIYVRIQESLCSDEFVDTIHSIGFFKEKTEEFKLNESKIYSNANGRILTINPPTILVKSQIESALESDRYGEESIIPKEGHRIYRMKAVSLMIFSYAVKEWKMALVSKFRPDKIKTVLNRYLALSLSPVGIVGFYGHESQDGVAITRPKESKGEAIYFDLQNNVMITPDGIKEIKSTLQFLRFDNLMSTRIQKMNKEELFSFLSSHCNYISYEGLSIPVRQIIQALSKVSVGIRLAKNVVRNAEC